MSGPRDTTQQPGETCRTCALLGEHCPGIATLNGRCNSYHPLPTRGDVFAWRMLYVSVIGMCAIVAYKLIIG